MTRGKQRGAERFDLRWEVRQELSSTDTQCMRFHLTVVVPKLAFRPLPYVTAIEGEMVNFTCAYNTSIQPLPHLIRWNRGSGASQSLANFRFYSTLSIQANRSNAGEYQCTTSNIFGIAVATTTLIVNCIQTSFFCVDH